MRFFCTVALLVLVTAILFAQEKKPTDLADAFPPAWQNDKARLFHITLDPSKSTTSLAHERDWLLVTLSEGDVTLAPEKARTRRIQFQPGHTEISTAASPTAIHNSGSTEVTFYLLDLTGGVRDDAAICGLGGQQCDSEYGDMKGPSYARSTSFDTPTVRAIETTIDPEAALDKHDHPFPYVMIALSDVQLEDNVELKAPQEIKIKAGEFRAFEAGGTHVIKNVGPAAAHFLTLEIK